MKTKDRVRELRLAHPDWTLIQIGKSVGASKQWAWQALSELGLATKRPSYGERPNCAVCGTKVKHKDGTYCSRACCKIGRKPKMVEQQCDWCGKHFSRQAHVVRAKKRRNYRYTFCNHSCHSHYFAIGSHGFASGALVALGEIIQARTVQEGD